MPLLLGRRRIAAISASPETRSSVNSQRQGRGFEADWGWRARMSRLIAARMDQDSRETCDATPLAEVKERIAKAAAPAGRRAEDVTLIAISKTHAAEAIRPLLEQGQRHFGENRVQEAEGKWPELRADYPDVTLHLVGQLQSNKAGQAVALFDVIHSLDRPSLVAALGQEMERQGRHIPCFVQVNIGDEPQKGGCAIADLPGLLATAREAGIPVAGLMCVPPHNRLQQKWEPVLRPEARQSGDVEAAPYFALLAKLAREQGLAGLSMGMSGDFETAVMLGATHVRVGSALFGARS